MPTNPSPQQILELVFPKELLENFALAAFETKTHARDGTESLTLTFEEMNAPPVVPEEHRGKNVVSKGFNRPFTVQHFPLQEHPCFLTIKTRRWEIEGVGTLERKLSFIPKEGLKLTTTFAAFLKETDRIRTGGG